MGYLLGTCQRIITSTANGEDNRRFAEISDGVPTGPALPVLLVVTVGFSWTGDGYAVFVEGPSLMILLAAYRLGRVLRPNGLVALALVRRLPLPQSVVSPASPACQGTIGDLHHVAVLMGRALTGDA